MVLNRKNEDPCKRITLIIASFNDAACVNSLLQSININEFKAVCIADGSACRKTAKIAEKHGVYYVNCPEPNRAKQFNYAACQLSSTYYLFLHADSLLTNHLAAHLNLAINNGIQLASLTLQFNHEHWFLKANAWFTKFSCVFFRFGDQGLLVNKQLFFLVGGFNENLHLLEDQEILWRLKKFAANKVLPTIITTSARKYLKNGVYRLQAIYFAIWLAYYLGFSQKKLVAFYRKHVN